ncbi:MAG: hypothetical protein ISS36_04400 [Candidatus Aenigmarchaeota archaeon]|nr:hypothetical protein [Candidatus Aenigmarchaeota archaeon]
MYKKVIPMVMILALLAIGTNIGNITGYIINDSPENTNFKTATFAICEDRNGQSYCEDRVFAVCNGEPIEVKNKTIECNNKTYNIDLDKLGKSYMPKDWKDPRPADFITSWAVG